MVLNSVISVGYSTVVESWALAVFSTKFFLAGAIGYAYLYDLDVKETVLDLSEYFVTAVALGGFGFMLAEVSAPSGGLFSELVAIVYFFVLFWNY